LQTAPPHLPCQADLNRGETHQPGELCFNPGIQEEPSMRVVIIGGTGHIGTYLAPRLLAAGHEVITLSRGQREPYHGSPAWARVRQIAIDRAAEEAAGTFGATVRELRPDVVIDLICFTLESARSLVEALRGEVRHFLHCGTLWV